ncbi:MAG TPA: sigma-70 family RNA polymerase sigma factor [Clostridiales bacterium]|nr:sigma-70 family RNA polymerase sigma factor [Clostridiales bacterium]
MNPDISGIVKSNQKLNYMKIKYLHRVGACWNKQACFAGNMKGGEKIMFRFPVKRSNEKENDDEEGLKKLYNQILSYCRQHLLDDTAAEECTQEVFALYFQKTSQTEIHNPRAWLYRTADNYLHRYNRNFQHEKQMTLPLPNSEDGADSVEDKRFREPLIKQPFPSSAGAIWMQQREIRPNLRKKGL